VMGYPDHVDYRDRCQSFSGLAAHSATWMNLGSGPPERIIGDVVTGNHFSVLGVRPALGRLIVPGDDVKRGASPVCSAELFAVAAQVRRKAQHPRSAITRDRSATEYGMPIASAWIRCAVENGLASFASISSRLVGAIARS
jgi:hypothetical protein